MHAVVSRWAVAQVVHAMASPLQDQLENGFLLLTFLLSTSAQKLAPAVLPLQSAGGERKVGNSVTALTEHALEVLSNYPLPHYMSLAKT